MALGQTLLTLSEELAHCSRMQASLAQEFTAFGEEEHSGLGQQR